MRNLFFLLPAGFFILFGALLALLFSREDIHMVINAWNSPFLDHLFRVWTFLGDGIWAGIVAVFLFFVRFRYGLLLSVAYGISGGAAQFLKLVFFSHIARPVKYFELKGIDFNLHLIEGLVQHSWKSFPSGHTATAFVVFCLLSLMLRSPGLKLFCLVLALGVAWSRMYLSQHFLMDVCAGAFLGILSSFLAWFFVGRTTGKAFSKKSWMDQPLLKTRTK